MHLRLADVSEDGKPKTCRISAMVARSGAHPSDIPWQEISEARSTYRTSSSAASGQRRRCGTPNQGVGSQTKGTAVSSIVVARVSVGEEHLLKALHQFSALIAKET